MVRGDKEGFREAIQGRHKGSLRRELIQAVDLLELIEELYLSHWVQEETRAANSLDLLFTNYLTIRGTYIVPNSKEFSDHHMVVGNFITSEKTDTEYEPVNYHMSDIPLYKLEDLDEEG